MKVILNQDVQNLGEEGDVRDVARGYARNFLFRKGFAVPYNKQNVAVFEHKKSAIEKRKEEKRTAATGLKGRIEELHLEMKMPAGDTGKLFGSVTAASLAEELEKHGINVEKKKISIPGTVIKMTGEYTFAVRLYEEETAECKVSIISDKKGATKSSAAEKEAPAVKEEVPEEETAEAPAAEEATEVPAVAEDEIDAADEAADEAEATDDAEDETDADEADEEAED